MSNWSDNRDKWQDNERGQHAGFGTMLVEGIIAAFIVWAIMAGCGMIPAGL